MWVPLQGSFCFIFLFVCLTNGKGEEQEVPPKISFSNETKTNRPLRDPAADTSTSRRMFYDPRAAMCHTIGSTAGALVGYRLNKLGVLTVSTPNSNQKVVDADTFIDIVVSEVAVALKGRSHCSTTILHTAATEMCKTILCSARNKKFTEEQAVAAAFEVNGVLRWFPQMKSIAKATTECLTGNFAFTKTGSENPQSYAKTISRSVPIDVMDIIKLLEKSRAKPVDVPPKAPESEQEYFKSTVLGAVISGYISKIIAKSAVVSTEKRENSIEISIFLSYFSSRIINLLGSQIPEKLSYKTQNVAIKSTFYWLINNKRLVSSETAKTLAYNIILNLGLLITIADVKKLTTNNAPVVSNGVYITFTNGEGDIDRITDKLEGKVPLSEIIKDFKVILPDQPDSVPEEVIRLTIEPAAPVGKSINYESKNSVGALPNPTSWYKMDVPISNSTKDFNILLSGTLGIVIGSHAAEVIKKFGIITRDNDPDYSDLKHKELYPILQRIIEKLVSRVMNVIPMTMNTGFYIVNSAFKTAKFSLTLKSSPLESGTLTTYSYLLLSLKQFKLLPFFPELQHIDISLAALPLKNSVFKLWIKPHIAANIEDIIKERILKYTREVIPDLLNHVIEIFKPKYSELSVFNLKYLSENVQENLAWDPPEAMSFIYEPPRIDGIVLNSTIFKESPKTPLNCPGQIFCPDDCTTGEDCGFYSCLSSDPWCYLPPQITCPGAISCPVEIPVRNKIVSCPENPKCPIVNVTCPGRPECPNGVIKCPGHNICPLMIKCPGSSCPAKYLRTPQYMIPCPGHRLCVKQPIANQLVCLDDNTCSPAEGAGPDIVAAIKSIASSIEKKDMNINVTAQSTAFINMNGTRMGTGSSAASENNDNASAAAAAAAASGGGKEAAAAAAAEQGKGMNTTLPGEKLKDDEKIEKEKPGALDEEKKKEKSGGLDEENGKEKPQISNKPDSQLNEKEDQK